MEQQSVGGVLTYPVPTKVASVQSGRLIDDEHWRKVADIFPLETNPIPGDQLQLDDQSEQFQVQVHNGRLLQPSLHRQGFTLVPNVPTAVQEFGNMEQVKQVYIDQEVVSIVKKAFAQSSSSSSSTTTTTPVTVIPFHWLVRDSRRSNHDSRQGPVTFGGHAHAPVARVHGDYTIENAPLRFDELQAKQLLPASWNKDQVHWGIVNVWRNIASEVITSKPLAVLDTTSLTNRQDIFQYWLVKNNKVHIGRNLAVSYDPNHCWNYFPQMTNTEALVFFTYETNHPDPTVQPRWVFHTAFDPLMMGSEDDTTLDTTENNFRASIETRCLVVFDSQLPPTK
jgi:hypothetical protein